MAGKTWQAKRIMCASVGASYYRRRAVIFYVLKQRQVAHLFFRISFFKSYLCRCSLFCINRFDGIVQPATMRTLSMHV